MSAHAHAHAHAPLARDRRRGSLINQQKPMSRLRLLLPAAAVSKPEAIGSAAEATAAPVEGLARSLQGVEVFDLSGKAVPIVDLWKDREAVVAFARHFGCVMCCAGRGPTFSRLNRM